MGVFLILTLFIIIGWTVYFFIGENATKASHEWEGTWLGDVGYYWIEVFKGTDSKKFNSWEQLLAVAISLLMYLFLFGIVSMILALIVKYLWFILLPALIISKIIIKFKIKK